MSMSRYVGVIVVGGLLGAVLFSLGTHLLNVAAHSRMLHDGQYGMIFMETTPVGWAIGAWIAAALAQRREKRPEDANVVAGILIVGGIILGPFAGMVGLMFLLQLFHG